MGKVGTVSKAVADNLQNVHINRAEFTNLESLQAAAAEAEKFTS